MYLKDHSKVGNQNNIFGIIFLDKTKSPWNQVYLASQLNKSQSNTRIRIIFWFRKYPGKSVRAIYEYIFKYIQFWHVNVPFLIWRTCVSTKYLHFNWLRSLNMQVMNCLSRCCIETCFRCLLLRPNYLKGLSHQIIFAWKWDGSLGLG